MQGGTYLQGSQKKQKTGGYMAIRLPDTDKRMESPTDDICWELSFACPCGATGVRCDGTHLVCDRCNRAWEKSEVVR